MAIDLHMHSVCSDGADTVEELIHKAVSLGLSAVALTDHDTVDGVPGFLNAAKGQPLTALAGIELSASFNGRDIHLLGYRPNCENAAFLKALEEIRDERKRRNETMLRKLNELGYRITLEEVEALGTGREGVISRLHFAKVLMLHGYTASIAEAFERILNPGCPGYVPRRQLAPAEAVHLLKSAGAICVLAHPLQYRLSEDRLILLIRELNRAGLMGLEIIHSTTSREETRKLREIADRFDLFYTGGSDYHGIHKPSVAMGVGRDGVQVPDAWLQPLLHA